jgi:hypothetical protein
LAGFIECGNGSDLRMGASTLERFVFAITMFLVIYIP